MKRFLALLIICLLPSLAFAGELVSANAEREHLGGKRYRTTIHGAPIAYQEQGRWKRIVSDWGDGDASFPHVVSRAKLRVRSAPDGMRRILPVPGDDTKYLAIGAPLVKNAAGNWIKPGFTGPVRSGNRLTWTNPNARLSVIHYGHGVKLDIELLSGYVPREGKFAFPVGINNLTRSGTQILDGDEVVMLLRPPYVYDAANPRDTRPIAHQFAQVGQTYLVFTLPDTSGMARPVVDPTVTLQPGAIDGMDTMFWLGNASNNYGVLDELQCGDTLPGFPSRSVIAFNDVEAISGAVSAALLKMTLINKLNANPQNIAVFRAITQWYEGNKNGASPDGGTDGSTWNLRNANGGVAWAGGPGGGSGMDYIAAATATTSVADLGPYTWNVTADVQTWLAGTATNYGWWLKGPEGVHSKKYFASSDHAATTQHPCLVIYHELPSTSGGAMLLGQ